MATIDPTLQNLIIDHIGGLFDGGSLEILSGATVLATFTLANPAFDTGSSTTSSTIDAEGLPITATVSNGGALTADGATLKNSDDSLQITGLSVALTGLQAGAQAHVELSDLTPADGATLSLVALRLTRGKGVDAS